MSTLATRQGARRSRGVSASARRTDYPDLSFRVKAERVEPALLWADWTDRTVSIADVPPEEWPDWTDQVSYGIPDQQKGS